nr:three-Cys-motif partner protein TcmP [Rhizobium sp. 16-449-1b]
MAIDCDPVVVKHRFGSSETERKLDCLRAYLAAYSTALSKQHYARIYVDAFAGTGDRTEARPALPGLFGGEHAQPEEVTTPGSARIAIETTPAFHSIVLIENDPKKVAVLKTIAAEYPDRRVSVRAGDANDVVKRICQRYDWHKEKIRGVVFLDPYGMEVDWSTVEAIGKTKALDCWYFFPLSGLYRNAPHDPLKLDASKIEALNRVFGTDSWRTEWYEERSDQIDLLGDVIVEQRRIADVDRIETWVHERLRTVFKGTVLKPLRLKHANGAPMASLFFAVSNDRPSAVSLATNIASHLLSSRP